MTKTMTIYPRGGVSDTDAYCMAHRLGRRPTQRTGRYLRFAGISARLADEAADDIRRTWHYRVTVEDDMP